MEFEYHPGIKTFMPPVLGETVCRLLVCFPTLDIGHGQG
jgi:hypothetical protein